MEIYKDAEAEHSLDSLRIFAEGERYLLLKQRPRRKLQLESMRLDDNKLISRSADQEFVYRLDVQPVIIEIVKRLLDTAPGLPKPGP